MSGQISVHDNILLGYEVCSETKKIILHTEFRDGGEEDRVTTDVVFTDVLGYHFEGDLFTSIIFGVWEESIDAALHHHPDLLERRVRYGWPQGWESKKESLEAYLKRKNLKVYRLQSSYGMDGFVMAASMEMIKR